MISEVIVSRLDELIGDYDTAFFSFLIYSYDLSLEECEAAVERIRTDICEGRVSADDNLVDIIQEYFRDVCRNRQKQERIDYLGQLMDEGSDFYMKFLSRYDVSDRDSEVIYTKIRNMILDDDIGEFEIRRNLEYYFSNAVRQDSYLAALNRLVGNYDTLMIEKIRRDYPNVFLSDLAEITNELYGEIIDGENFTSVKNEFLDKVMRKSESKKAEAISKWQDLVLGNGDSFSRLLETKNLSLDDGEAIRRDVENRILDGLITADRIDGVFLTRLCIDYGG